MADIIHPVQQTTIDALSDEVCFDDQNLNASICLMLFPTFQILTTIFDRLKFYGNLRCSLVCKRWFNVVNKNVEFMRTVNFQPREENLLDLQTTNTSVLTRDYRTLLLYMYSEFSDLTNLHISLLKKAEYIKLWRCKFQDFLEFKKFVDCCPNAKEFFLHAIEFDELKDIEKETRITEDITSGMVRPVVKCTLNYTSWRVLQCFDNVHELVVEDEEVYDRRQSGAEKLLFIENYASALVSIDLFDWTSDELLLLSTKSQLKLKVICATEQLPLDTLEILKHLFIKQHSTITACSVSQKIPIDMFDDICEYLHNLETFECTITNDAPPNFNNLKKLKKLRSLSLNNNRRRAEILELDIGDLPLTEFKLSGDHAHLKIVLSLSKLTMPSVKKLHIVDTYLEQEAFKALITLMPNLEYLSLYFHVSLFFVFNFMLTS
jgi:hypothetical protein